MTWRSIVTALVLPTAACDSFLSQDGPHREPVINGASILVGDIGGDRKLAYALVGMSSDIIAKLEADDKIPEFPSSFTAVAASGSTIGVGDMLSVTIFESGAGGLFIPVDAGARPGNFVTLPSQQVSSNGDISVPFAGNLKVAGLTPEAAGHAIEGRLAGRALEPQAVVTITDRRANAVEITGDVTASARFAIDPGGERLLGALARAGGPKYQPYETIVTVQRNGDTARALLSEVMRNPQQNVALRPGDTIYVSREQRYFLALGALGPGQYLGLVNRRLPFEDYRLSLADAIAKVGGLSDDRANGRAVFVYRFETAATLAKLGASSPTPLPAVVPTVYYVDLTEPAGYFLANQYQMHNEDLIFVSNSPSTDLAKFLALVLPASYSAANFKTL